MEVRLISFTPEPLKLITVVKNYMRGKHLSINDISEEEAREEFIDCTKTLLLGPFEFVHFTFAFDGVSRSFTHQLVRTRLASYVQESLRFSAKVGNQFQYLVPNSLSQIAGGFDEYRECMLSIQGSYENLIKIGVPTEDSRGVLPTNILTSITQDINYSSLVHEASLRLCSQSQAEHREAMEKVKELIIKNVSPLMGYYLQPSCVNSGSCGWESKLDRLCPLQNIYPMRSDILKYSKEIKSFIKKLD